MKRITPYLLSLVATITIGSCAKNKNENSQPLSARELLTLKPWRLLSYGYDNNSNGLVDSNEEEIKDCERDNTYIFNKNGSGVVQENSNICTGVDPSSSFAWTLTNNDTVLDFYFGTANIVKLSSDSLYLTDPSPDPIKLLLIYSH